MTAENNKVCYNCRHCIRSRDKKYDITVCQCEINKIYLSYPEVMLSYAEVMAGWCRHWANEQEGENE